ncbi:hypothetical protein CPHO_00415 [Corynebacterium phocae]|uniref:Uncharacterized protein n=1 Tax=Corynebacterium phocae TaxID=161895 RepID=A0A1L7D0H3_9CORY|nr:hypothetical protein [Corynebacterium phocae]APT91645.1 hypothetical protein CPHO_00415 [Corynebacterium phocae]KAA8720726.1 hypothetical protein F4V58_12295 [Corynebacterium phocae]
MVGQKVDQLLSASEYAAIQKVASRSHIVLYCGSGVTIDLTGMGWGALNAKLAEAIDDQNGLDSILKKDTSGFDQNQKASVVFELLVSSLEGEDRERFHPR